MILLLLQVVENWVVSESNILSKRKKLNQTKGKKLKKEFHYIYENIFSINDRGFEVLIQIKCCNIRFLLVCVETQV